MTVLIAAIGSRGDVVPCVGLGVRLKEAGFDVAVAAHEPYGGIVRDAGLEFRPVPGDVRGTNNKVLLSAADERGRRTTLREKAATLETYWRNVAWGMLTAAGQGADVLLLNHMATLPGYQIAEALRLPSMGMYGYPVHRTGDFPPVTLPTTRSFGRFGNALAGRLTNNFAVTWAVVLRTANAEFRRTLSLPPLGVVAAIGKPDATRWPVLYGYSPALLPRPADWRPGLDVVGFWWPRSEPGWQPPPLLMSFVEDGPPPVFIGFGSATGHGDDDRTRTTVVRAIEQAGARAVIQTDSPGVDFLTDRIVTVDDLRYEWLFPRTAATICHAGAGTIACSLQAGIPTVGVPLIGDQWLWAGRLARVGVGPPPIPFKNLTVDTLADAMTEATRNPVYRTAATRMAKRMSDEDGAASVIEAVSQLLDRSSRMR